MHRRLVFVIALALVGLFGRADPHQAQAKHSPILAFR
jgi:hypothetical protein